VNFANATAGGRWPVRIGDGYIHPDFPDSAPDKVQPSGPAVNPYSLSTTGPATSCETTTGT
jgi:hypothetical protein